jgi:predicted dithiol-disulfide oxidoreductase (DUF899 family)
MIEHEVVSHANWVQARKALLAKEKELTKARDALSQARRELPWEKVETRYVFDGPVGEETLSELFDGRSQLVVYHFMFGPDASSGCKGCSFWADNFERSVVHLAHRDVTMIAVSRGPLEKLTAFQKRFGWTFKWVSSARTDFNFAYGVSLDPKRNEQTYNYAPAPEAAGERPGISVFYKDESGEIYHTYSAYARGLDLMNATYNYLDLVPKGRDEKNLSNNFAWLRLRDSYDADR